MKQILLILATFAILFSGKISSATSIRTIDIDSIYKITNPERESSAWHDRVYLIRGANGDFLLKAKAYLSSPFQESVVLQVVSVKFDLEKVNEVLKIGYRSDHHQEDSLLYDAGALIYTNGKYRNSLMAANVEKFPFNLFSDFSLSSATRRTLGHSPEIEKQLKYYSEVPEQMIKTGIKVNLVIFEDGRFVFEEKE